MRIGRKWPRWILPLRSSSALTKNIVVDVIDKYQVQYVNQTEMNSSDLVFVCVPTPTSTDGLSCDVAAVEIARIGFDLLCASVRRSLQLRSIRLIEETGENVAYSPEYLGMAGAGRFDFLRFHTSRAQVLTLASAT
jgi:hypothetical protein